MTEQRGPEYRRVVVDHLGEVDVTADAETRHNLALQHLWNARHAARLCGECEAHLIADDDHEINHELRGHAMTALISAAAFLESLVNEVFQDAVDRSEGMALNGLYSLREGLQRFRRRVLRLTAQLRLRLAGVHDDRGPPDV
jgi:hypothetical protein